MATKYVCRHCGSDRVQGTLPAWFRINDPEFPHVDTDFEADFEYGWCEACEHSDNFSNMVREVEQ